MEFGDLLACTPRPTVDVRACASVEGWMADEAADLTIRLGHLQAANGKITGVLEMGVFKGKYLSLLASIFQGSGAPVVGVDAFILHIGEMVATDLQEQIKKQIASTIMTVAPRSSAPSLIAAWTNKINPHLLRAASPNGFSFISVDAGHEAPDVENDLGLAEAVMTNHAVIAADDVFNPKVPGVMEGTCRYFARHPESVMAPFAYCGNKLFFSNREMHSIYLAYVKWIMRDQTAPPYVSKAALIDKGNKDANFVPRLFGYELVTFDWN